MAFLVYRAVLWAHLLPGSECLVHSHTSAKIAAVGATSTAVGRRRRRRAVPEAGIRRPEVLTVQVECPLVLPAIFFPGPTRMVMDHVSKSRLAETPVCLGTQDEFVPHAIDERAGRQDRPGKRDQVEKANDLSQRLRHFRFFNVAGSTDFGIQDGIRLQYRRCQLHVIKTVGRVCLVQRGHRTFSPVVFRRRIEVHVCYVLNLSCTHSVCVGRESQNLTCS